jgi:putative transposase
MPYAKIMLHVIWATKNRSRIINEHLKPVLLNHIKENSISKGIYIDSMNCVEDHIHLLISLGVDQTVAKVVMLLKGESSFWVNKQKIIPFKFEWQDEYIALSVSESVVEKVRSYIATQEEHHKKKTFKDEFNDFLISHKFENILHQ